MSLETAEFAYDLHAGLSTLQVPEFDQLQIIGMAATLAVNIKGLGDIEYEVLRKVSDHFMSITRSGSTARSCRISRQSFRSRRS